jgi:hypothetical protein
MGFGLKERGMLKFSSDFPSPLVAILKICEESKGESTREELKEVILRLIISSFTFLMETNLCKADSDLCSIC